MPKRRRRPLLRALLAVVLLVVAVVAAATVAVALLVDPNHFKPQIEAAVARATGGTLALDGKIRIGLGLPPRVVANDIGFVGRQGTARLHLTRLAAQVALLPLLAGEVDIVRLDLVQPDLTLAAAPVAAPPPAPAAAPPAAPGGSSGRLRLAVRAVHVVGGVVRRGALIVAVPRLDAVSAAPGGSLVLSGEAISDRRRLALSGEFGPVEALLAPRGAAPWPVQIAVEGTGARLAVRGTLTPPLGRVGYALQVDAAATDFAAVAPFLPWHLPPLQDASLSARVVGVGQAPPQVSALTLHLGGLDLGAWLPGLRLARADLTAPDLHHAAEADVQAILRGMPIALRGTIGPFGPTLPLALAVTAPPALTAQANGVVTLAAHPALRGTLAVQKLDLDALLAALPHRNPPPVEAAPAAQAGPSRPPHVIPDTPFDLAPLRRADADLQITIAALATGGATYSDVAGHLVLTGGRLTLDPFGGNSPGGRLDGKLAIDAAAPAPPIALSLRAPALSLAPLAAAFGHAGALDGHAAIDADLKATGDSPHALAATLSGTFALSARDADIDNALLVQELGDVLRAAKLPEAALGGPGRTRLRCLEVKLRAAAGIITANTLLLDSAKVAVQGSGTADLANETLNLRLRPMLRLGPGIVVPVRLTGSFAQPKPAIDTSAAARVALGGAGASETCGPGGAAAAAPGAASPAMKLPKTLDILRGQLAH